MKKSKQSVDYSPGMKTEKCSLCAHYIAAGICELVQGKISSSYWCSLFQKAKGK